MGQKKPKQPPSDRARSFMAWCKANGLSTKAVARDTGIPYTTLATFVQGGTREIAGGTEEKVAQHYGVETATVFGGAPHAERRLIPVVSWVSAGKLADPAAQVPAEGETIEISGLSPGDYFATRVRGDSMDRLSPEGSLILVNRAERDPVRGRRYIFSHRGEVTYKRFETEPVRLEPESTVPSNRPIFPRDDEDWSVIGRVRLTLLDDL